METDSAHNTVLWPAPVVPGLLVSVRPGGEPVVEAVTPQLAAWLGRSAASFDGCALAAGV